MSKFKSYMKDRKVEDFLSEEERETRIYDFYQALAINRLEGEEMTKDEEEYALYCALNNISFEEMIDVIFSENGWAKLDHAKAKASRLEYEKTILKTNAG